ncbi:glycosyltransferase family 4 protein [Arthrobacter sp. TMN-49]
MVRTLKAMVVVAAHPNPELYGADRVFLETVEGLVAQGHRVVATLPETGPLWAELTQRGAEVVLCPTPVLRKSARTPLGIVLLAAESLRDLLKGLVFLRKVRPDAVYVSTVTIPLWILLSRMSAIPVLAHVHEAEKSVSRLSRLALATPLLLANAIVANSRFSADVLTGAIPRLGPKISVVYNGVPGPPSMSQARAGTEPPLRVLYVGRLSNRKGVGTLIAAMFEVKDRNIAAHLDIVGAVYPGYEWYEAQLRDQTAALGLEESVTFHGFCPDVWPYLERTDISVVPSRIDEPFGNTAVEAILAGRPLVVSNSAGLLEAAGGYLSPQFVAVDSPEDIADAIERIGKDWTRFRAAARQDAVTAANRHNTRSYQQQMVAALAQITRP